MQDLIKWRNFALTISHFILSLIIVLCVSVYKLKLRDEINEARDNIASHDFALRGERKEIERGMSMEITKITISYSLCGYVATVTFVSVSAKSWTYLTAVGGIAGKFSECILAKNVGTSDGLADCKKIIASAWQRGKTLKRLPSWEEGGRGGEESTFRMVSRIRLIRGHFSRSGYPETKEPPLVQDTGNGRGRT